ncbi:MAG: DUF1844 domain-containing protein [Spirochaetes bacterium]|nr:DUF1844 domain-containing protein [Spirochaetota bacterium]
MAKKKKDELKSARKIAEEKAKKAEQKAKEKKPREEKVSQARSDETQKTSERSPMDLTFSSYLIMLGALGWQFLGKVPSPATGKIEKDLMQAKQIIDLLEILEEKTKNNLSQDEGNILRSTLVNLRLNYVEEAKKGGTS